MNADIVEVYRLSRRILASVRNKKCGKDHHVSINTEQLPLHGLSDDIIIFVCCWLCLCFFFFLIFLKFVWWGSYYDHL